MSLVSFLRRVQTYYRRLPAARAFLERHGLRATVMRVLDELAPSAPQDGLSAVSRWLDNAKPGAAPRTADLRALARPTIAIIGALDLPQCKKYRILQKIEQLDVHGCRVVISNYFDVPRSFDVLQLATGVIFYRVPEGDLFQAYLAEARRLGLAVTYDIDDPVFCRTIYATNANLQTLAPAERAHLLNDSRRYLAAMQQCDAAILSTPGLIQVARPYMDGKPAYLWRNALDAESQAVCADVTAGTSARNGALRIGYMSGSRAHDLDFALIAPALATVLNRYEHAELVISGHASVPGPLQALQDRIAAYPFSSYPGYFRALRDVDIVVIPLLADNFNACKSAIRFLEAAAVERPCVISMVGDFLNVASHGKTAYLAETESDWVGHLADLIESEERRKRIGVAARQTVFAEQTSTAIAEMLDPALLNMLKGESRV
jgi:glycosyltransferase involved in cell wall biosynthesis